MHASAPCTPRSYQSLGSMGLNHMHVSCIVSVLFGVGVGVGDVMPGCVLFGVAGFLKNRKIKVESLMGLRSGMCGGVRTHVHTRAYMMTRRSCQLGLRSGMLALVVCTLRVVLIGALRGEVGRSPSSVAGLGHGKEAWVVEVGYVLGSYAWFENGSWNEGQITMP